MTNSRATAVRPHLHGVLRLVIQLIWLAVVGLLLVSFAAGVPVRLAQLQSTVGLENSAPIAGMPPELQGIYTSRLGPAEAAVLNAWGLSLGFYAAYIVAFEVGLALACAVIGIFIFWRRPDDWVTLWMSFILVLLGTVALAPELPTLATLWAGWGLVFLSGSVLGMVSNVHLLFLSPDGTFVPPWTMRLTAAFSGVMLALVLIASRVIATGGVLLTSALAPVAILWLGLLVIGIVSQVYRYRHLSNSLQRQQTKWLVVGLAAVIAGFVINATLLLSSVQQTGQGRLLSYLVRAPAASLCMALLPVCLAFSILRYRLWDIDLIIRRTLIYSGLTAALAGVYLVSIVVLQSLFGAISGDRDTPLVTVVSTLAIAALFVPLRRRLQEIIDRLFYRRKYDAAQTMAAFGATLRDETDLARLAEDSLDVVHATMQPAHVSLWLSPNKPLEKQ
jgi:hypothetical protein